MLALPLMAIQLFLSEGNPVRPHRVTECVARHKDFAVDNRQRPSYLDIRFSSQSRADIVVAVTERASRKPGLLICTRERDDVVLINGAATNLKEEPEVKFELSSKWNICSKSAVAAMRQYYSGVPSPINESVCFLWEDGEAVLYRGAKGFGWKALSP